MIELKDLSDEELEKKLRASGVVRRYPGLQDWTLELLERYNNKKAALTATETLLEQKGKECERLELRARERALRRYGSRHF